MLPSSNSPSTRSFTDLGLLHLLCRLLLVIPKDWHVVRVATLPGFPVHTVLLSCPFLHAIHDPWLVLLPAGGTRRYVLHHGWRKVVFDLLTVFIHVCFPKGLQEGANEGGGICFHLWPVGFGNNECLAWLLLRVCWYDVAVYNYGAFMVRDAGDVCNSLHEGCSVCDVEVKDTAMVSWFLLHLR